MFPQVQLFYLAILALPVPPTIALAVMSPDTGKLLVSLSMSVRSPA